MNRFTAFLRNLFASPDLPALLFFAAAGLCAGMAIIGAAQGDARRAVIELACTVLFTLAAYVYREAQR